MSTGNMKLRFKIWIAIVTMTVNDMLLDFTMSDLIYSENEAFGKTKSEYLQSRTLCFCVNIERSVVLT